MYPGSNVVDINKAELQSIVEECTQQSVAIASSNKSHVNNDISVNTNIMNKEEMKNGNDKNDSIRINLPLLEATLIERFIVGRKFITNNSVIEPTLHMNDSDNSNTFRFSFIDETNMGDIRANIDTIEDIYCGRDKIRLSNEYNDDQEKTIFWWFDGY